MPGPLADPFCSALGMSLPIVQAPVGRAATPALAAAVSSAGGLGTLALSWVPADRCAALIDKTRALASRPIGANFVLEWPQHDRVRACLEAGVSVISTSWGDPAPYTAAIHAAGALHVHMVGSAADARAAADAGVDAVVAQGWEAGGHVVGTVATLALVPAVVDAVGPLPVLAAGGIADGRGLAAVLALGAVAGWVGTRFLLAEEADVHPQYRRRLADGTESDTSYTSLFDGGWPNAPHRVLRNATVAAWEAAGGPASGSRPGEDEVVALSSRGAQIPRYFADQPTGDVTTDTGADLMALYAGQGVGLCHEVEPAAVIARTMTEQAWQRLRELAAGTAGL